MATFRPPGPQQKEPTYPCTIGVKCSRLKSQISPVHLFVDDEFVKLKSEDNRPMLVALHGITGGSHEIYLRQVLAPLVDSKDWEACVVNSRGCAGSKLTSGVLYNARATWDVRQTVKWLRERFPNRPLYGAGFSLGANILTNYLGEEGEHCQLDAAVVVSNPWNLEIANHELNRTWIGREVYSKTLGQNMKKLFEEHKDQLGQNPNLNMEAIRNVRYLYEFDREVQGPVWGYPTEGAYYRDASCCDAIFNIRIPVFAIQAKDDPIAVDIAVPYQEIEKNPFVVLCTTSLGGHLSWFEWGGTRWFAKPAVNFLDSMAKTVDREAKKEDKPRQIELATAIVQRNTKKAGAPFTFEGTRRKFYVP